ncbi:MAG: hypothetical protein GC181_11795 [Bacteroidetes bacterium]|nr:hypothetical protein [Bacteroidota bacterium]
MKKYIIRWLILLAGLILILAAWFAGRHKLKNGTVQGSKVIFNVEITEQFVSEESILNFLRNHHLDFNGKPVRDLPLGKAEEVLEKQPFIKSVDCYVDLTNHFVVDIKQRKPIIRIYPKYGDPYYIDEDGDRFPLSTLFSADVVVASGNILPAMNSKLYKLAVAVHQSDFWEGFIEHIFVSDNNDIVFTTQIAGHQVVLGDVTRIEEKLSKLEAFYEKELEERGWEQFKVINLEYRDQVICRK